MRKRQQFDQRLIGCTSLAAWRSKSGTARPVQCRWGPGARECYYVEQPGARIEVQDLACKLMLASRWGDGRRPVSNFFLDIEVLLEEEALGNNVAGEAGDDAGGGC